MPNMAGKCLAFWTWQILNNGVKNAWHMPQRPQNVKRCKKTVSKMPGICQKAPNDVKRCKKTVSKMPGICQQRLLGQMHVQWAICQAYARHICHWACIWRWQKCLAYAIKAQNVKRRKKTVAKMPGICQKAPNDVKRCTKTVSKMPGICQQRLLGTNACPMANMPGICQACIRHHIAQMGTQSHLGQIKGLLLCSSQQLLGKC